MNGGPVQNDALAWLRRQPSGLADALVTDPPAGPQGAARPAWTAWTAWLAEGPPGSPPRRRGLCASHGAALEGVMP